MIKNYFKTAWRNITGTLGYSALNIAGLSIGMAIALLIGLWVYDQYSYDKFVPDHARLYRVQRNYDSNGDTLTFRTTSIRLADALRSEIPEIEYVAESDWMGSHGLMVGDKKFYMNGGQVGTDFLKMFKFPLLIGNIESVLGDPSSIVLTEATAKSLFGNESAIGKTIRFDNKSDLKVTGILKDLPSNSSIKFNFLVPSSYAFQFYDRKEAARSFSNNNRQIFVKLKQGVSYAQVAPKIRVIEHTEKGNMNAMNSYVTLQPMDRWHLYSNYVNGKDTAGFLDYVNMFTIIGVLVLLIACINFINLTTARSEKRAKEVGVRKAIGSRRKDLVIQFLLESFLLTLIAALFSLVFVALALNPFNALTGSKIGLPVSSVLFWVILLAGVVFISVIAGSRPAFYLSSFNPVKVLKGTMQTGRAASLPRKILVVTQFSCSIALIISTVIIYQQIQHAKNRPSGYDLTRLMGTDVNNDIEKNFAVIKNELLQKRIAESVTTATSPATDVWWHTDIDQWPGKNAGETVEMGYIIVADDYFKTVGMQIKEGRVFSGPSDTLSVIFNEAAINRLRIKTPVGQLITYNEKKYTIAGVVKDALMISPFKSADPTMFTYSKEVQGNMLYRLRPGIKTQDAINQLTAVFNRHNPSYPYIYSFADANYAEKFNLEVLIGKLSGLFAAFAIFISCLGLFGLAAYVAEQRTKEIGIRKVLGASVSQVWMLLSKDFIVLVLISCVIASPLAFYFLSDWLQKYDYRINIGAGVFVVSALVAIAITIITISFQAIKAAIANPVKSLRTE
jgi:putative ABC transport system permease protein